MLVKAYRSRDLASYSLGNIALANLGNAVHSVYVYSLHGAVYDSSYRVGPDVGRLLERDPALRSAGAVRPRTTTRRVRA